MSALVFAPRHIDDKLASCKRICIEAAGATPQLFKDKCMAVTFLKYMGHIQGTVHKLHFSCNEDECRGMKWKQREMVFKEICILER